MATENYMYANIDFICICTYHRDVWINGEQSEDPALLYPILTSLVPRVPKKADTRTSLSRF